MADCHRNVRWRGVDTDRAVGLPALDSFGLAGRFRHERRLPIADSMSTRIQSRAVSSMLRIAPLLPAKSRRTAGRFVYFFPRFGPAKAITMKRSAALVTLPWGRRAHHRFALRRP